MGVSVLLVLAAAASVAALDRILVKIAVAPTVWNDEYERRLASGRRTWPLE